MCSKLQSNVKIAKSRLLLCALAISKKSYLATLTPKGVPVLWQDGPPVVHISHFLVSNVQSKFYRLLLLDLDLDLVFFFNSNEQ